MLARDVQVRKRDDFSQNNENRQKLGEKFFKKELDSQNNPV
jgi:hypothetical protein